MTVPSVHAASVNECRLPTTLTLPGASLTTAAISSVPDGWAMTCGAHRWLSAQLCQTGRSGGLGISGPGFEGLDQLGEDLVHIAHDPDAGDREDRRLLALVDG